MKISRDLDALTACRLSFLLQKNFFLGNFPSKPCHVSWAVTLSDPVSISAEQRV